MSPISGAQLFVRYAYPPNALGYCGPAESEAFFEYGTDHVTDGNLIDMARRFHGAWPYLQLISSGNGIEDPLDHRVVEAYWLGNGLLERLSATDIQDTVEKQFRPIARLPFSHVPQGIDAGAVPHHNFHVFIVSPWLTLLGEAKKRAYAVSVMENCRIRWGTVVALDGDQAVIRSSPLVWDGKQLSLAEARHENARIARDGSAFLNDLVPGDVVSLHWDWVCDRLTRAEVQRLRQQTKRHLNIANTMAQEGNASTS